jgi:DNA-binding transcriptional LysR family regulator
VPQLPQVQHELVGESKLVVAMRTGHPLAAGELTAQRYAAAEHVAVSRRGSLVEQIDDVVAESRLHRSVVTASATITVALQLARLSDLVVTVPDVTSRGLLCWLSPPLCDRHVGLRPAWRHGGGRCRFGELPVARSQPTLFNPRRRQVRAGFPGPLPVSVAARPGVFTE